MRDKHLFIASVVLAIFSIFLMKLTFLSADRPLTKTHILQQDGSYESTSYPMSAAFSSHEEHISTIEEFYEVLIKHAAEG